jgi:hypothetical protein
LASAGFWWRGAMERRHQERSQTCASVLAGERIPVTLAALRDQRASRSIIARTILITRLKNACDTRLGAKLSSYQPYDPILDWLSNI